MAGNPFRYGDVATGSYFTNRVRELDEVRRDIRTGQNIVIISPRRYGKTSLIVEAIHQLQHEHVLVAYLDLFRAPTKDRFADLLASAIYDGLVNPVERAWQNAVDLFQKLPIQPKVTVGADGNPSFEFSAGQRSRDLDRTIEELLRLPGKIAADRHKRVALVLDEFQQILEIDEHLPGLMRAVFQMQGDVAHVFMGSKRHLMHEVFTSRNQPLYRMAKPVVLRPIEPADFAAFIRARCAETGQGIADDAVARILAITESHPHDTQELCYFAWVLGQSERIDVLTAADVERALEQVLDAEDAHYTSVWEGLSAHQRLVLEAITEEPGTLYSEEYRGRHRLGAATSVQRSIKRLLMLEIIDEVQGTGYRINDVFLRAWIRRLTGAGAKHNGL